MKEQRRRETLLIVFVGGVLLLNYPLLSLFSLAWLLFGIPLLYLYLFAAWLVLILLVALILRKPQATES